MRKGELLLADIPFERFSHPSSHEDALGLNNASSPVLINPMTFKYNILQILQLI